MGVTSNVAGVWMERRAIHGWAYLLTACLRSARVVLQLKCDSTDTWSSRNQASVSPVVFRLQRVDEDRDARSLRLFGHAAGTDALVRLAARLV